MKAFPLALAAIVVVGCAPAHMTQEQIAQCGPKPTEAQVQAAVNLYIQKAEKDPDAAKVRNTVLHGPCQVMNGWAEGGGATIGWLITTEINGKNGYGAYAGYEEVNIQLQPDGSIRWGF